MGQLDVGHFEVDLRGGAHGWGAGGGAGRCLPHAALVPSLVTDRLGKERQLEVEATLADSEHTEHRLLCISSWMDGC